MREKSGTHPTDKTPEVWTDRGSYIYSGSPESDSSKTTGRQDSTVDTEGKEHDFGAPHTEISNPGTLGKVVTRVGGVLMGEGSPVKSWPWA